MIEVKGFTPKEIVSELDRFIIGQKNAKKAVAVALRNRWRRRQIGDDLLRKEIMPKNILMIGPTGVGKTEISRRLATLAEAPFVKVEATKFTEVGYVGRDVEQIIRDLVESAIRLTKAEMKISLKAKAEVFAQERVLDELVGTDAADSTRDAFRKKLIAGELDDKEIEIDVEDTSKGGGASFEIPGMPGAQVGMLNLGEILGSGFSTPTKRKKMTVHDAHEVLVTEESEKLLDMDEVKDKAIKSVEENGIVFLDEIDKICGRNDQTGRDVSREGVQRDLLPLIEGTAVSTKHGTVKTDHILFIASGAFHVAKPSDLLPELQGRLPIRVELDALTKEDFVRILKEPEANLVTQYTHLLKTEGLDLTFTDDAIEEIASLSAEINQNVENIGARRLQTVMEKTLEEISFKATEMADKKVTIDAKYVRDKVGDLAHNADLSKFIL